MFSTPMIAGHAPGGSPRRRSSRRRIESLVYVELGPGNGGFPIDVSETGMSFQGIQPLQSGQPICIKFKLPGTSDPVQTSARIAWLNELGKGGGLQFIDLPEECRGRIHHWLSLQAQPNTYPETVPGEFRRAPISRTAINQDLTTSKNSPNSVMPMPGPAASTAAAITANAGISAITRNTTISRTPFQEVGNRRGWFNPFAIGVIALVATGIAVFSSLGVLSVQFRWPHATTDQDLARLVPDSGPPPVQSTSEEKTSDNKFAENQSPPMEPSAIALDHSTSLAQRKLRVTEPLPKVTGKSRDLAASKRSTRKAVGAMLTAPRVGVQDKPADFVPPTFAIPTMPGLVPQALGVSAHSPAPIAPAVPRAGKSGKFDAPRLITRKDPAYPQAAKSKGVSGSVELAFTITAQGTVSDVAVIRGNEILVRAAVEALQTWHYQPARLNGIPTEAQSTTIFNFKSH